MAEVIKTKFDGTIEEDVQLEQIDGKPPAVETTLANAENVYKSFLYLREMYSMFPSKIQTLDAYTSSSSDYKSLNIPKNVNRLMVTNTSSDTNLNLRFNGSGEYVILPLDKEKIEIIATTDSETGTQVEYKGYISVRFVVEQEF